MKKNIKVIILFSILFLSIGFAAVNTVLNITGNLKLAENIEDFNVYFYSVKKEDEKVNEVINESKNKITIDTSSFTSIGEKQTYTYRIANSSRNYDANVSVNCTPTSTESFSLTNVLVEDTIEASKTIDGTITLEYLSETTGIEEFTCLIEVEAIERTELADEFRNCDYEDGTVWEFSHKKEGQKFDVPCDGTYKIELWGAQGGSYSSSYQGGKAAYTSGEIELETDTELFVYVGSQGGSNNSVTNIGGYNGGGYSGNNAGGKSMGGGGATDIRLIGGEWNNFDSLKSRIMVASAGGGYVYASEYSNTVGCGGALTGRAGGGSFESATPTGGTQIAGGTGRNVSYNGNFGYAPQTNTTGWGGGGGSGYFAGATGYGKGGAGGSSFVSGCIGCQALTETSTDSSISFSGNVHYSTKKFGNIYMIDGFGTMPTTSGTSYETGHSGNGYAKITLVKVKNDNNYNLEELECKEGAILELPYSGNYKKMRSKCNATYKIELWGAQGGSYSSSYPGGKGAYTSGNISLKKDEEIFIYVGGQGGSINTYTNIGGYNGGGMSGYNLGGKSMGGGGATDVRLLSGTTDSQEGLNSRIMVAAGGGGNVYAANYSNSVGYGGALTGGIGNGSHNTVAQTPASQTSPGTSYNADFIGYFGYGRKTYTNGWGGGGGGGYYSGVNGYGKGGAGGSSFISGYTGCNAIDENGLHTGESIHYSGYKFTNSKMIAGNASMPTHDGTSTMTGNSGNGYAKITVVSID